MAALLGPNGSPIDSIAFKKAPAPAMGPAFGAWVERDTAWNEMPGSAILSFDLTQLTLADYRQMRYHPQVNVSLTGLAFMLHQLDWKIKCDDARIREMIETNLREIWTRLIRALSQAFWAGFSPNALEYENTDRYTVINKVKDLIPEECYVHWKRVPGTVKPNPNGVAPSFYIFDGIDQTGMPTIPPANSLWYPLLMENGNHFGRKLLKAAFAPWYFSILIHLFANRYYERFGEPTPIGRYPSDTMVEQGSGQASKPARVVMEEMLLSLRNRSVVNLPSDRQIVGIGSAARAEYEWTMEYLESQMRGADFERYMARLDEEISMALFTPMLLMRSADVGSHNLGVQHVQTWLWFLNALAGDMKEYIDRYIVNRLHDINFGPNAAKAEWSFRPMGKEDTETIRSVITALIGGQGAQAAKVDLEEIGQIAGLSLTEVHELAVPPPEPTAPEGSGTGQPPSKDPALRPGRGDGKPSSSEPRATGRSISNRIAQQVEKAWRDQTFGKTFSPTLGYRRKMELAFQADGADPAQAAEMTGELYERVQGWLMNAIELGADDFESPKDFIAMFDRKLDTEIESIGHAYLA